MTVNMIATKRFRLALEKGFVWLDPGAPYTVETETSADRHEETGRGRRAKPKSEKPGSGKKGQDD